MFYIKVKDLEERTALLDYLKENDIGAVFHYVDIFTTNESEKLPMYYNSSKLF